MGEYVSFVCQGDNLEEIPESIALNKGLTFPEAHTDTQYMALLARELKMYKNDSICRVPFCVTVEAEALGANIKYGDMKIGPRVESYAFKSIEELENIKELDLTKGRIKTVLEAVELLSLQGETTVLSVEGPFTIISSLMDPMIFYKALRKNKESVEKLLHTVEDSIVKYIIEGINKGAKIISYGDPAGAMDIVGPKVYSEFSGKISYNILKKVEPFLKNSIIHLCGKTSTALESIGLISSNAIGFKEVITYGEAIERVINEEKKVSFIGNSCIKRTPLVLQNTVVWEVNLIK